MIVFFLNGENCFGSDAVGTLVQLGYTGENYFGSDAVGHDIIAPADALTIR